MEPCKQEKSLERIDTRVTELERQFTKLSNSDAETRVYLKLLIESNDEIKLSLKEVQSELKDKAANEEMLAAIEKLQSSLKDGWVDRVMPHFASVIKWGLVFAAAITGIKLTL
jgi:chromosome segregation ATPase